MAIIRLRSLGDCVLSTPAFAILKRFRSDLKLAVVVEDRFREVLKGNPDIDDLLPPVAASLRHAAPRLCLNLHGGTRSAWLTLRSGAQFRGGFAHFRFPWVYNIRIPRAQEILGAERKVHTAEHLASAIFHLGAPITEVPGAKLAAERSGSPCAVIHAAATGAGKTWPAENFVEVARRIQAWGSEAVFIGGTADDLAPFQSYRTLQGAPLSHVKSLMASASLFVGNDSGPAHMAAAFGVPSVVLFGSSDPAIWGPWRTPCEVLTGGAAGIAGIPAERVLAALERLRMHA